MVSLFKPEDVDAARFRAPLDAALRKLLILLQMILLQTLRVVLSPEAAR
jgi:hypothetical protein